MLCRSPDPLANSALLQAEPRSGSAESNRKGPWPNAFECPRLPDRPGKGRFVSRSDSYKA